MEKTQEEINEYLAKIRRTVSESEALLAAVQLRFEETDRLLAANGLTREQILEWHPTKEQRLALNEELRKQGLPPLEENEDFVDFDSATAQVRAEKPPVEEPPVEENSGDGASQGSEIEMRQKKFNNFMQELRL